MKEDAEHEILSLRAEIKRLRESLTIHTPSLPALLRRRGFRIYKKEPSDDLILPGEQYLEDYYRLMHKYSFRLFLRDIIKHQETFTTKDVTHYATQGVTEEYVAFLASVGLIAKTGSSYHLIKKPITSFGPTLEWFLAEVFKREFSAESIWGVKFKRAIVGGDYDLISKINGSMLCMEIKSSPPKQIYANEITAFLDRVHDLFPEIAVFFMDTELRMKDKIVPMFEEELRRRAWEEHREPPAVRRIEKELFQIENKIYIINAKDSVVNNIERVLSWYFRRS